MSGATSVPLAPQLENQAFRRSDSTFELTTPSMQSRQQV